MIQRKNCQQFQPNNEISVDKAVLIRKGPELGVTPDHCRMWPKTKTEKNIH